MVSSSKESWILEFHPGENTEGLTMVLIGGLVEPWLTRLRSQYRSQRAVTPFANEDSLEKINRRIVTLFEAAKVVPS
jgi:hypothetical protein